MWYFTWILGLTAALLLAVMNAMWYEAKSKDDEKAHLSLLALSILTIFYSIFYHTKENAHDQQL